MAIKLCLVCLKHVQLPELSSAGESNSIQNEVTQFLNILAKYINAPRVSKFTTDNFYVGCIVICSDCNSIVKIFCDLYSKWDLLQLQLSWHLEVLMNTMSNADKVLSRNKDQEDIKLEEGSISVQHVQQIRAPLIKQGQNKLSAALPRVTVSPLGAQVLQNLFHQPMIQVENGQIENNISATTIHVKTERESSPIDDSRDSSPIPELHLAPENDTDFISTADNDFCSQLLNSEETNTRHITDVNNPQELTLSTKVSPRKSKNDQQMLREKSSDLLSGRKFKCGVCEITFENYIKYRKHLHFSMVHQRRLNLLQKKGKEVTQTISPAKVTKRASNINLQHINKTEECLLSEDDFASDTSSGSEQKSKKNSPAHKRSGKRRLERKKCTICQYPVVKGQIKQHFKYYHDVKSSSSDEVIHCPVNNCHAYFLQKSQKRYHVRQVHQTHRVSCSEANCKITFDNEKQLKFHLTRHGKFKCNFCAVEETYAPHLATHEQTHIKNERNVNTFQCSRCNYSNATKIRSLVKHFCREHMQDPLRCTVCSGSFKYHDSYEQHVSKCQSKVANMGRACICALCFANFATEANLCHHKITEHWNLQCPECQFKPGTKLKNSVIPQIRIHIQRKHPQLFPELPFTCKTCKLQLPTQDTLDDHIQNAHPKFYPCDKCEMKFTSRPQLLRHLQNDHGERRFVCPTCEKPFVDMKTLNRHMRYHKDPAEWKFGCDTCGKRFMCNNDLTKHLRTHTGEKPYVCEQCGEKFTVRANMNAHVKRKHSLQ